MKNESPTKHRSRCLCNFVDERNVFSARCNKANGCPSVDCSVQESADYGESQIADVISGMLPKQRRLQW